MADIKLEQPQPITIDPKNFQTAQDQINRTFQLMQRNLELLKNSIKESS